MTDEKQYPSFAEQSSNIANTAFDIFKGIIKGEGIIASPEIKQERLDICAVCDKNDGKGKCVSCGCVLDLKIPWAMSDCPEGKWEMDEDALKNTFKERFDKTTKNS